MSIKAGIINILVIVREPFFSKFENGLALKITRQIIETFSQNVAYTIANCAIYRRNKA